MIALALSIILAALAIIVICVLDIRTYWANKDTTLILSCCVLILGMCAVIVICALGMREKIIHHEDRYPAKEYRVDTEIITRGDISDTTYIITKK